MAVPDAVMVYLRGIADSPQVADHPQVETLYSMASTTVNTTPWGSNASFALALVTAHYCLLYPPSMAHIDRTPVQQVDTAGGPTRYMDYNLNGTDASFRQTAPGRQYLDLRARLLGSRTPIVI